MSLAIDRCADLRAATHAGVLELAEHYRCAVAVAATAGCIHLDAAANHRSKLAFERAGWRMLDKQMSVRGGLEFERFQMVKELERIGGEW